MTTAYNSSIYPTTRLYACYRHLFCNAVQMGDLATAVQMLRTHRERLGWSTREVASQIESFSEAIGDPIKLTQQAVSKFENGRGKSIPVWVEHFAMMMDLLELPPSEVKAHLDELRSLNERRRRLPNWQNVAGVSAPKVTLPSEDALVGMFEGFLEIAGYPTASEDAPLLAVLARELAQQLPIGLLALQGPLLTQRAAPATRSRALATDDHGPRQ